MILQTARVRPAPYYVAEVKHDEVLKMSVSYFSSIRPEKKIGDPKVHDLRAIQYTDDGKVYFKLSFSDKERSLMPQRQQITAVKVVCEYMFSRPIPIIKKVDDLHSMKHVMPCSGVSQLLRQLASLVAF